MIVSMAEINQDEFRALAKGARDNKNRETKFPPHIMAPVWTGMIAACALFWAFVIHALITL